MYYLGWMLLSGIGGLFLKQSAANLHRFAVKMLVSMNVHCALIQNYIPLPYLSTLMGQQCITHIYPAGFSKLE